MEEEIKLLNGKIDKLTEMVYLLGKELLNSKKETIKPIVSSTTKTETVRKDVSYLESLLERCTIPSSQKFLQSLINNNYPTLTLKQNEIVENIAEQI